MNIVYLDQNKWIELARAINNPNEDRQLSAILERLGAAIESKKIAIPLTSSNIYETHKVNNYKRRQDLAFVQVLLSQGMVIRGRKVRKIKELRRSIANCLGRQALVDTPHWFLSRVFSEAFVELDDDEFGLEVSSEIAERLETVSDVMLFQYLVDSDDAIRRAAVRQFSGASESLRIAIEERRAATGNETQDLRRKIYSALLLIDDVDLIMKTAQEMGVSWFKIDDIGRENALRIVEDTPIYYIEREIALRLEVQDKKITENDFRDMLAFTASLPYVDMIIGENNFVNISKQAGLHRKFSTRLETNFQCIVDLID